jgi:hypothetical protein
VCSTRYTCNVTPYFATSQKRGHIPRNASTLGSFPVGYVNSFQEQFFRASRNNPSSNIMLFSILKEGNKLAKLSFKMTTMQNNIHEEIL